MGEMKCEIPPEVTSFKEKFFLGLTVRQLACVAGAAALAIPTGILGSNYLSSDLVQWLVVLEVGPFAAIGFLRYNDMPLEVIGKKVLEYYFFPQKRKYIYTPLLYSIQLELLNIEFQEAAQSLKLDKKTKKKKRK